MSNFVITDHRTRSIPVQAASLGELVPLVQAPEPAPPVVAAATTLLTAERRFSALTENRGRYPAPTGRVARAFNKPMSWGIVAALGSAAATSPFLLVHPGLGIGLMGFGAFMGGFIGAMVGDIENPITPLQVITRLRTLEPKDVAFVEQQAATSPLNRAVLGLLAERWIKRIDKQRLRGNAAFCALERAVKNVESVPAQVRADAERTVALYDAMLDPQSGHLWRSLRDGRVEALIAAFEEIPSEQRQVTAAELLQLYFKGDVPRVDFESQQGERRLYRTLSEALHAQAAAPDVAEA